MRVAHVACAVAGHAGDLDGGEHGGFVLAPILCEGGVEELRRGGWRHGQVGIRGQRLACGDAADGPPSLHGFVSAFQAREHPLAHFLPELPRHGFHRGEEAQHVFVAAVRGFATAAFIALRGLLHGLLHLACNVFEHLHLLRFVQACSHASPEHPPFGPVGCLLGVGDALFIKLPDLRDAPIIELRAHAGAQAPAREVEPHALVLGRAATALAAFQQRVEQRTQHGHIPRFARAQNLFDGLPKLAHFLRCDVLRLIAEDAVDLFDGGWQLVG